jgi:hypothetical protein
MRTHPIPFTIFDILDGRSIVAHDRFHRLLVSYDGHLTLQIWEPTYPPTNTGLWEEKSARTLPEVPYTSMVAQEGNTFLAHYLEHEVEVG